MRQSIRLGRIAGIPVGVNWSVVVIAALITWTLAGVILPDAVPDQAPVAYWSAGLAAAALFFASLVTHEFAHALVARRNGVEVTAITLWLLGGVSQVEAESLSAGAEFRTAIAGPLTSFGLGAAFGSLGAAAGALHLPELVGGSLWWLGMVNVVLGTFNLLPAYPLDGGRVLRSLIWGRSGDRMGATRAAARVGRIIAWTMIGLGMLLALSGDVISGLWIVLLGWFLEFAGRAEVFAVVEQRVLAGLRADQLMSSPPVTVPAWLPVDRLLSEYVIGLHHSAFPVVDEVGRPTGLVGLDQVRALPATRRSTTRVGEIALGLGTVAVVGAGESGVEVLGRLTRGAGRRALVIDEQGQLVGIITTADITRAIEVGSLSS